MNEFITAGGIFMWPLLACSVLIIAFSIERSWFLQKRLICPDGLSNQIKTLMDNDMIDKRHAEEIANLSSLGFLLINCIKYKNLPRENLESKIEEKAFSSILDSKFSLGKFLYLMQLINKKPNDDRFAISSACLLSIISLSINVLI